MPDQRQPDQPIDRNRDIDRNQQSDRPNQQGLQGSGSDRQNQGLQGSSWTSGDTSRSDREQDRGLDSSRRESTSSSGGMQQQDRMESRQDQPVDRNLGDDVTRRRTTGSEQGISRPYDTDDMEAQDTSELDEEGFGDSRTRNQDEQRGRGGLNH